MATNDAVKSVHATLSGTTADLVLLTQFWDRIEVENRDSTDTIYVVFNTSTAPTAGMDEAEVIPAGKSKVFIAPQQGGGVVGSTTAATACHRIGIVGDGGAYSVTGIAGKH